MCIEIDMHIFASLHVCRSYMKMAFFYSKSPGSPAVATRLHVTASLRNTRPGIGPPEQRAIGKIYVAIRRVWKVVVR